MDKYAGLNALFDPSRAQTGTPLDQLFGLRPITEEEREEHRRREREEAEALLGEQAYGNVPNMETSGAEPKLSTLAVNKNLSPTARAALDVIAGPESSGAYNVRYGGAKGPQYFSDYSQHPHVQERINAGPEAGQTSGAAGRYQLLYPTWQKQANLLGLKDYTPESQDLAAWNLMKTTYASNSGGRDLESDLQSNNPTVHARVNAALRGQWRTASFNPQKFQNALARHTGGEQPTQMGNGSPAAQLLPSTGLPQAQEPSEDLSGFEKILLDNGQEAMMRKGMSHDEAAEKLKAMGIDAVPTVPFKTPSGETIPMRYNMTEEEAHKKLAEQFPQMMQRPGGLPEEDKTGYLDAAKQGVLSGTGTVIKGLGDIGTYVGQKLGPESEVGQFIGEKAKGAHEYGEQMEKRAEEAFHMPKDAGWLAENVGYPFMKVAGEAAPYVASFAVPGLNTVAGPAALLGGAYGEAENKAAEVGKPFNFEEATPYALADTALNYIGGRVFGPLKQMFGPEAVQAPKQFIQGLVAEHGIDGAKARMGSLVGDVLKGAGISGGAEIANEVAEDMLYRGYGDQDLFSEDALKGYLETAKQVAPFGIGMGGVHGAVQRHAKTEAITREEEQYEQGRQMSAQDKANEIAQLENDMRKSRVTPEMLDKHRDDTLAELEAIPEDQRGDDYATRIADLQSGDTRRVFNDYVAARAQKKAEREAELPADIQGLPTATQTMLGKVREEQGKYYAGLGLPERGPGIGKIRKELDSFDINNPQDVNSIAKTLDTIEAEHPHVPQGMIDLRTKLQEIRDAHGIEAPTTPDVGGGTQPQGGEEDGGTGQGGQGIPGGGQEGRSSQQGIKTLSREDFAQKIAAIPTFPAAGVKHITTAPNAALATAMHSGNVDAMFKALSKSENPFVRHVAKHARRIPANLHVEVNPRLARNNPGRYTHGIRKLEVRPNYADNEWVVTHELMHGMARHILDNPQAHQVDAVKGLTDLHALVSRHPSMKMGAPWGPRQKMYGTTNVSEFVSEGFSNPEFQHRLSQIKIGKTTAWNKFTRYIGKLLGFKEKDHNALTEFLTHASHIVETAYQTPAEYQNAGITEAVGRPTTDSTGAPIHTTQEGVDNFWKNFGDTKVVDNEGRPLRMYHGTRNAIVSAVNPENAAFDRQGLGSHFTQDAKVASGFARSFAPEGSVYPVYLNIKNPMRIKDFGGSHSDASAVAHDLVRQGILPQDYIDNAFYNRLLDTRGGDYMEESKKNNAKELARIAKKIEDETGHDGFVYENTVEGGGDTYIPFHAEQIKSAIGNKGTFDTTHPDLSYLEEPELLPDTPPTPQENKALLNEVMKSGLTASAANGRLGPAMGALMQAAGTKNKLTAFQTAVFDERAPIQRALRSLGANVGKYLRADLLWSAYSQRGNTIQQALQRGYNTIDVDGSLSAIDNSQLAPKEIYRRIREHAKALGISEQEARKIVDEMVVRLRAGTIREEDAKRRAYATNLLARADELESHANSRASAEEKKKFLKAAKQLRVMGEQKLEEVGEGRTYVTPEQVAEGHQLYRMYKDTLSREVDNIHALLQTVPKMMRRAGLINKEQEKAFIDYAFYFPLYDQTKFNEDMIDPLNEERMQSYLRGMGRGLKSVATVQKQEHHAHAIYAPENLMRHLMYWASASAEHMARKSTCKQLELVGGATRLPSEPQDKNFVIKVKENGEDAYYRVVDPTVYYAFQTAAPITSPILSVFRTLSSAQRKLAVFNPLFWYRQIIREPKQASRLAKVGVITPLDAMNELVKISMGTSKGYTRIAQKGIMGPVDLSTDTNTRLKHLMEGKGMGGGFWEGLNHIHEAVDASTRAIVYERALAKYKKMGMVDFVADALAIKDAREIMNFSRQGKSNAIRMARSVTPFLGSWLNGLDVMARAMAPEAYGNLSKADAMEARREFYGISASLMVLSMAYALAMSDDEEWVNREDRNGNVLVRNPFPNKDKHPFIAMPVEFEIGWLQHTLPENMLLASLGAITPTAMKSNLKESAGQLLMPPLGAFSMLHDPIMWILQQEDAKQDYGTSRGNESPTGRLSVYDDSRAHEVVKDFARYMDKHGVQMSPNEIEKNGREILGSVWTLGTTAADYFLADKTKLPAKTVTESIPWMTGVFPKQFNDVAVRDAYNVLNDIQTVQNTFAHGNKTKDLSIVDSMLGKKEFIDALAADQALSKLASSLHEISTQMATITAAPAEQFSPAQKREINDDLAKRRIEISKEILSRAKMLGVYE